MCIIRNFSLILPEADNEFRSPQDIYPSAQYSMPVQRQQGPSRPHTTTTHCSNCLPSTICTFHRIPISTTHLLRSPAEVPTVTKTSSTNAGLQPRLPLRWRGFMLHSTRCHQLSQVCSKVDLEAFCRHASIRRGLRSVRGGDGFTRLDGSSSCRSSCIVIQPRWRGGKRGEYLVAETTPFNVPSSFSPPGRNIIAPRSLVSSAS
jgi:hypothetical protein